MYSITVKPGKTFLSVLFEQTASVGQGYILMKCIVIKGQVSAFFKWHSGRIYSSIMSGHGQQKPVRRRP